MKRYPLTLNLGILVFIIIMMIITANPKPEPVEEPILNNPMLIALDSIAENYESEGWTSDAAYLMAGVEVDLYDESDSAIYALYQAYKED